MSRHHPSATHPDREAEELKPVKPGGIVRTIGFGLLRLLAYLVAFLALISSVPTVHH